MYHTGSLDESAMFGISVSFNYELYRGKFNSWCAFTIINYYLSIVYISPAIQSYTTVRVAASIYCIRLDHWMSLLCVESVYHSTKNFIEVSFIVGMHFPSSNTTCQFYTSHRQFRVTLQYG
jgi:hypothetical protein